MSAEHQELEEAETCDLCAGNGEIVTDWDRYLHPLEGDVGDEAVAVCPDCGGRDPTEAVPMMASQPLANPSPEEEER